jgi:hypothetical protein
MATTSDTKPLAAQPDILSKTTSAIMEEARQLPLDPMTLLDATLLRCRLTEYPNHQRLQQASAAMQEAWAECRELMFSWNIPGLRRRLAQLEDSCRRLAIPPPRKSFADYLSEWTPRLEGTGLWWSSLEIECLQKWFAHPDDAIVRADIDSITLLHEGIEVTLTREEINDRSQLGSEWTEDYRVSRDYLARQRAYREAKAKAAALQAESVPRISSGPSHLIGRPVQ